MGSFCAVWRRFSASSIAASLELLFERFMRISFIRMYVLSGAYSALCIAIPFIASFVLSEGIVQMFWLCFLFAFGLIAGYQQPLRCWHWGFIIAICQPVLMAALSLVTGELLHPQSSTGGPVALGIFTAFAVIFGPLSIAGAFVGGTIRSSREQPSMR